MKRTKEYFKEITDNLERVLQKETGNIEQAAFAIADAALGDRSVYIFGCNHSAILAQEMFYRTGGLAIINPIITPGLTLETRPVSLTTGLERVEGIGQLIVENEDLVAGDVLIVHSVSGRNAVAIDVACEARKLGVKVIGLTNLDYSTKVCSRHSSGKNLYEVCDIVLDNCGQYGDAVLDIEGVAEKVAPASTVIGAAILNALVGEVVQIYVDRGVTPPVFVSSNVEGGDAHNEKVLSMCKDRIYYMKG